MKLSILLFLVSIAYIPASIPVLNAFDPPKRLLWAVFFLFSSLALGAKSFSEKIPRTLTYGYMGLLAWMLFAVLRSGAAGVESFAVWLLPPGLGLLGFGLSTHLCSLRLGRVLIVSAGIQMSLMLLQYAGLDPLFGHVTQSMAAPGSRMLGTIGYQNQALDFVVVCFAGIFLSVRSQRWRGLAFLAMVLFTLLTGTRTGLIALLLAGGLVMSINLWSQSRLTKQKRGQGLLLAALIALLTLGGGLALLPGTAGRFEELIRGDTPSHSLQSRLWMYRVAAEMIQDRPLTGWGPGAYPREYPARLARILPEEKDHALLQSLVYTQEAHSDPLQFWVEFGAIGFLLLLFCGLAVLRLFWKGLTTHRDAAMAGMFVCVYMVGASLFSFSWQYAAAGPLAGLMIGYSLGRLQVGKAIDVSRLDRVLRYLPFLLSLFLLIPTGYAAWMNVKIPRTETLPEIQTLSERLPRGAYRYRAVLGGLAAAQGDFGLARTLLEEARPGYQDARLWETLGYVYAARAEWTLAREIYQFWADTGLEHQTALQNLSVAEE